jgi:hypothetical protein
MDSDDEVVLATLMDEEAIVAAEAGEAADDLCE